MIGIIMHAVAPQGPYQVITPENAHLSQRYQLSYTHFGWKPDCKPKCLHHLQGEVLLERLVTLLHEYGVTKLRMVVGYKADMIREFNEKKKLGLEIIYNPNWEGDISGLHEGCEGQDWLKGFESVKVGLKGVDDDVLLTLGDVHPVRSVMNQLFESKTPLVMCIGHIWKMSREYLRKFNEEVVPKNPIGIRRPIVAFFKKYGDVCDIVGGIGDVDGYNQTDEYRKEVCRKLQKEGLNFIKIAEKVGLHPYFVKQLCLQDELPTFWIQDEYIGSPMCETCYRPLEQTKNCVNRARVFAMKCPRERILAGEQPFAELKIK